VQSEKAGRLLDTIERMTQRGAPLICTLAGSGPGCDRYRQGG
jgi:hypothetical protein